MHARSKVRPRNLALVPMAYERAPAPFVAPRIIAAHQEDSMHRRCVTPFMLLALATASHAAPPRAAAKPAAAAPAPAACEPGEPAFWKDQGLGTKVSMKLQFHKPLMREKVGVKVTGGAVMLYGNVSSRAAIAEAVKTAAAIEGVKCVQDFLQVGPPLETAPQQQP
jgi:hypothetical protein